jgi:nucleotide-binding universal stress UspA family protein
MPLILVPLDFSDCAPHVVAEALRFSEAFCARLLLLHASDPRGPIPLTATVQPPGSREPMTVEALLRRDADAHLAPLLRLARERGVEADGRVEFGHVAEVVLAVAAGERADMILMGTHGRTGLARATMGSIAEDIVRHAEVPVITVRTRHHAGCAASSCATCDLGRSEVERAIDAEDAG